MKRGHKVKQLRNKKFVSMPPEKGTPWKLQVSYGTEVTKSDLVHDSEDHIKTR